MATITREIPDEIVNQYASLDEIRQTMYEDFVIEQRQQGIFSLGEAARLLNITYAEFFVLLGKKGLSFRMMEKRAMPKNCKRNCIGKLGN